MPTTTILPQLISQDQIRALEAALDDGPSVAALRRFNAALRGLTADNWGESFLYVEGRGTGRGPSSPIPSHPSHHPRHPPPTTCLLTERKLRPAMHALAHNLESFNPAFAAVLLAVQCTIGGGSDYARRDAALAGLIQPLAGEYGMHNGRAQAATHRALFRSFYEDLLRSPLADALAVDPAPAGSAALFRRMMADVATAGGRVPLAPPGSLPPESAAVAASYALGYNLAIEYLADYEKTWMLDSFRALDAAVLAPAGRGLTHWLFLEVHAEGEAEHAAIGHAAAAALVPAGHEGVLRAAMADHDRDFATFYNELAAMLE
jgi:hypothetical protein